MSCPEGYDTPPYCQQCAPGYWMDQSLTSNVCHKCASTSRILLIISVVVGFYTLAALIVAVLNVKAGVNRKSIHSLVFKLALAFVAGIKTYQTFLKELLEFNVKEKSQSIDPLQWLSLGFVQCLIDQATAYPIRFRDSILIQCGLPFLAAFVATVLAAILIAIAHPMNRKLINRKRHLADLLLKKDLDDVAQEVGDSIDGSRTCGIWRYASYEGIDPATWLTRFLKDMVPTYIATGILLYSSQLARLSHLIACGLPQAGGPKTPYSYNVMDRIYEADPQDQRPLVTAMSDGAGLPDSVWRQPRVIKVVRKVQSVQCIMSDDNYRIYLILGWLFIILWGVGVPVLCFGLLRPHAHELSKPQILQVYGFLHNGYTQSCWFFELVFFARKAAITLGSVFTNNTTTYTEISILISLIFLAIHSSAVPFDRRNLNVLNRLDTGGLLCWVSSLALVIVAESLEGSLPRIMALAIVGVNASYVLWLAVALHQEIANWCRSMSPARQRALIIGPVIRAYARHSKNRKEKEPRVLLLRTRNEIGLAATQRRADAKNQQMIKMYKTGVPYPPKPAESYYLIQCLVDTFSYFLTKLRTEKINGEMALYILRTALVRRSHTSEMLMSKSIASDMPESEHAAFVESLKIHRQQQQDAEQARLQKLQTELDAYFAGKDPMQAVKIAEVGAPQTKQQEQVSLAALFESDALANSIPISEFYALIYQLGHTSQDTARFEKYQAIKFIHERKEQDARRARWNELKELHTQLIEAVNAPKGPLDLTDHAQLIQSYQRKSEYLDSTLEFCLYRPLDFVGELTRREDAGLDPLTRRLEPIE